MSLHDVPDNHDVFGPIVCLGLNLNKQINLHDLSALLENIGVFSAP